jgi:hypothetical protein
MFKNLLLVVAISLNFPLFSADAVEVRKNLKEQLSKLWCHTNGINNEVVDIDDKRYEISVIKNSQILNISLKPISQNNDGNIVHFSDSPNDWAEVAKLSEEDVKFLDNALQKINLPNVCQTTDNAHERNLISALINGTESINRVMGTQGSQQDLENINNVFSELRAFLEHLDRDPHQTRRAINSFHKEEKKGKKRKFFEDD